MNRPPKMYLLTMCEGREPGVGVICDGCQTTHPLTDCRLLRLEEVLELEPTHFCTFCSTPLLPAGVVKKALEALGFEFVTHAGWSAWMRNRPLGGSFNNTDLSISVVEFLSRRPDWHAPLDDEDGPVVLKRCRTWPLVQPDLVEVGIGAFHWVQEHEAKEMSNVTAMIAYLRAEG